MYTFNESEKQKIFENFIKEEKMKVFPSKERKKYIILHYFINLFEKDKKYSEKEVNEIIKRIYPDFSTIRRYLVDYKFINRTKDCKEYWID